MRFKEEFRLFVTVLIAAATSVALYSFMSEQSQTGMETEQEITRVAPVPADVSTVTEERVRAIVAEVIAEKPELLLESLNSYMQAQQAEEQQRADGVVIAQKEAIADTEGRPYLGNEDGEVELVYFYDLNCPHCKRMDPALKQILEANPDVRISHRGIPILAPSSRTAAIVEGLVWSVHRDKYPAFHDALMGHQGALTETVIAEKLATVLGEEDATKILAFSSNAQHPRTAAVIAAIDENLSVAQDSGITGTPFIFVVQGNGIVRGAGPDPFGEVTKLIEKARKAN